MCAYRYKILDHHRREIRVLRFLYHDESNQDVATCTLHHVSLDDLQADYCDFIEANQEDDKRWIDKAVAYQESLEGAITPCILAGWRFERHTYSSIETTGTNYAVPPRFKWGDFEAVSYCWESDLRDTEVLVDGCRVQIPKNLEAALQHLKLLPEARAGMAFWIDGICIDQSNLVEKNHQVNLMKEIYAQALSTVIWLGPGDEESDRAADVINAHQQSGTDDLPSMHDWNRVFAMWSRNYFKRMWIIQELAMNKTLSFFMCGNKRISRRAMKHTSWVGQRLANYVAGRMMAIGLTGRTSEEIWQLVYHVHTLLSVSSPSSRDEGQNHLSDLLDLARKAKAKDPKDKIYGLLGLFDISIASQIKPDYDRSKDAVYFEFAKIMLQRCQRLDEVLCWCAFTQQSDLPSWVPDWTSKLQRNHLQWFLKHNAGGNSNPLWSVSQNVLHVRGAKVDIVVSMSASAEALLPYKHSVTRGPGGLQQSTYGRYGDMEGVRIALNTTLAHGHLWWRAGGNLTDVCWIDWQELGNHSHLLESNDWMVDHWKQFDQFRQSNSDFFIFGSTLRSFFPSKYGEGRDQHLFFQPSEHGRALHPERLKEEYDHGQLHADNIRVAAIGLRGRRLVTTHDGSLGLVPEQTQIGDVIAVLVGCNYPVVLRPRGSSFIYMGECYLHELMDGKALDRGVYPLEDISIV